MDDDGAVVANGDDDLDWDDDLDEDRDDEDEDATQDRTGVPRLLALSEVRRSKGRFAMLIAGTGLLVFVLLFQQLLLGAVVEGLTGAVARQSGEVLVFASQSRQNLYGSLITPAQLKAVRDTPGVEDASELAVSIVAMHGGLMTEDAGTVDAAVLGYRPDRPGSPTNIVQGRAPQEPREVVASEEDAPGRYRIGSVLRLEPGGTELTVVGLTAASRYNVAPTLWVPWVGFSAVVLGANPDAGTILPSVVALNVTPGADVATVKKALTDRIPDVDAVTREDAAAQAPGIGAVRVAFIVVMGLGYLVVGFVVSFFFLTLTLQKESSISLLRAIGASEKYLVRSLFIQVLIVTVGGLAVGLLLLLAALPVVRTGVPVAASPGAVFTCAFGALAVALLGAIPPMRRTMKADPFAVVGRPSLGGLG